MKAVNYTRPDVVSFLPDAWALSIADGGLWRHADVIVEYRPKVGMFHFNGRGHSKESFWLDNEATVVTRPRTFEAAMYYVNLPWPWVLFRRERMTADGEAHELVIHHEVTETKMTKTTREKKRKTRKQKTRKHSKKRLHASQA